MRLLTVHALLVAVFFVSSSRSAGPKSAAEQPGISRSGSEFLEEGSSTDSEWNRSPVRINNDATCLGRVEGFADGFTAHEQLLSLPEKERMVCVATK